MNNIWNRGFPYFPRQINLLYATVTAIKYEANKNKGKKGPNILPDKLIFSAKAMDAQKNIFIKDRIIIDNIDLFLIFIINLDLR